MFYTYVLLCKNIRDNSQKFYVSNTYNLRVRLNKHKSKSVKTTKKFDKIILIYYEACLNKTDARKRELQLKTGFGRGYLKRRLKNYMQIRGHS
ncbi:hypothetical protein A2714_00095 [Candidatus Woesebacteria bacterium RIFCSPHIGHO2_01_FULL_38_9]|uniref:GIY-YIG domain-containing protein n=2 Tax=Candidatus Woeseibacteriota TaxID=1752722 RepID=A0A1F7Y2L0_9BACT|nr:MAG: hypothetical protein A2714_00095 [Candidatus Woesebacteria bacterium RIFCSPHIGHO2_01_FULL_38_9]OGM58273.1 MAG: hypothetical protein A3A75_04520 [Candidatus Woesebacteria bacterium RIFCSPLOWO2_01_FULL_39_10]